MKEELKVRYEALKEKVQDRGEEFGRLCDFIEQETTWLTAPASVRHHLPVESGLLEHSCNVAENMVKLKEIMRPELSDESCIIVALLHDLGKVGMPGAPPNI